MADKFFPNQVNLENIYEVENGEVKRANIDTGSYLTNRQIIQEAGSRQREATDEWMNDEASSVATGAEIGAEKYVDVGKHMAQAARYASQGLSVAGQINDAHNIGQHMVKGHGAEAVTEISGIGASIEGAALGAEAGGTILGPWGAAAGAGLGAWGGSKAVKAVVTELTGGDTPDLMISPPRLPDSLNWRGEELKYTVTDSSGEAYTLVKVEDQHHWYHTRTHHPIMSGQKIAELTGLYAQAAGFDKQIDALTMTQGSIDQAHHADTIRGIGQAPVAYNAEQRIKHGVAPDGSQIDVMYAGTVPIYEAPAGSKPTHMYTMNPQNNRLELTQFGQDNTYQVTQFDAKLGTTTGIGHFNAQGKLAHYGGDFIDSVGQIHSQNQDQQMQKEHQQQQSHKVQSVTDALDQGRNDNAQREQNANRYHGAPNHYTPPKSKEELEVDHLRDMYPPPKSPEVNPRLRSDTSNILTPTTTVAAAAIDPAVVEQSSAILGYIKADPQIISTLARQGITSEEQLALVASYATRQNFATGNRKVTDMDCDPDTGRLAVVVDHRLIPNNSDIVIFNPQQALSTDLMANLTQAPEVLQSYSVAQAQDMAQFQQQQAIINQNTTGPVMTMSMTSPNGQA